MSQDPAAAIDPAQRRRIDEIRRQIAAGTYETPDKLQAAVDAMLKSFDADDEDTTSLRPGPLGLGPNRPK